MTILRLRSFRAPSESLTRFQSAKALRTSRRDQPQAKRRVLSTASGLCLESRAKPRSRPRTEPAPSPNKATHAPTLLSTPERASMQALVSSARARNQVQMPMLPIRVIRTTVISPGSHRVIPSGSPTRWTKYSCHPRARYRPS